MKYKRFSISVFEREPGKWRARINPTLRRRLPMIQFANSIDHSSADEAMTKAMELIDALPLSRNIGTERHWRCLSKHDHLLGAVTSGAGAPQYIRETTPAQQGNALGPHIASPSAGGEEVADPAVQTTPSPVSEAGPSQVTPGGDERTIRRKLSISAVDSLSDG